MTALRHEQAVLDEQHQTERKVIREYTRPGETERQAEARAVCTHPRLMVLKSISTSWDDHLTAYGHCPECQSFVVVTDYTDGRSESRPMSCSELERYTTVALDEAGAL